MILPVTRLKVGHILNEFSPTSANLTNYQSHDCLGRTSSKWQAATDIALLIRKSVLFIENTYHFMKFLCAKPSANFGERFCVVTMRHTLGQHSGPYLLSTWIELEIAIGPFWCKEDRIFRMGQLLNMTASLIRFDVTVYVSRSTSYFKYTL